MQTQLNFGKHETGTLYLVPTPIGNLEDMTFRSVRMLKEVDLIAAEDTRNTQKLLNHFEIETKQISFHEHNTQERIPELITLLQAGKMIAQVSDAGMPSISDPGHELVAACIKAGIPVVPLPGANAGLTALIASGLQPQPFYFYGFLPRKKKEMQTALAQLVQREETVILYEAPHRLKRTLTSIATVYEPSRPVTLCRELTKRYEEFIFATLSEAIEWATQTEVRGEFVVILGGNPNPSQAKEAVIDDRPLKEQVQSLIEAGMKPNAAIKEIAKQNELKKQDVYNEYHELM